jgi:hypothetical protein
MHSIQLNSHESLNEAVPTPSLRVRLWRWAGFATYLDNYPDRGFFSYESYDPHITPMMTVREGERGRVGLLLLLLLTVKCPRRRSDVDIGSGPVVEAEASEAANPAVVEEESKQNHRKVKDTIRRFRTRGRTKWNALERECSHTRVYHISSFRILLEPTPPEGVPQTRAGKRKK